MRLLYFPIKSVHFFVMGQFLFKWQGVRSEAEVEHARLQNINEGTEKVAHLLGKESQGEKLLRDQLTSLHAKWDSLLLQLDSYRETVRAPLMKGKTYLNLKEIITENR